MTINDLMIQLRSAPTSIEFKQVMQVIDQFYDYTATGFTNGDLVNEASSNQGSCKIFCFARLNGLTPLETLSLFGVYYRHDVLSNPGGTDHGNIRNFMVTGWAGVKFANLPLTALAR
jgi:hypothetical protein